MKSRMRFIRFVSNDRNAPAPAKWRSQQRGNIEPDSMYSDRIYIGWQGKGEIKLHLPAVCTQFIPSAGGGRVQTTN